MHNDKTYNHQPSLRSPCVAVTRGRTALLSEYKVVFVDYMVITASGGGSFVPTALAPSPTGVCTFVDTVIGVEKEDMQDRLSVRVSCDTHVAEIFPCPVFHLVGGPSSIVCHPLSPPL